MSVHFVLRRHEDGIMLEKKNEKEKIKLRGQLKLYIQWPSVMAVLLVAMNVWVYMIDKRAGSLMVFFVLIYIIMAGSLYLRSKTVLLKDLVEFAAQYGIVQNTLLKELTVPYAILMSDGKTIWRYWAPSQDGMCRSASIFRS